jgi:hypothetical protein
MPTNSDIAVEASDMVVKRELHTKCATPGRLSQELKDLLGDDAQFKVEVRRRVFYRGGEERQLTLSLDAP